MPELPEVETLRRQLETEVPLPCEVVDIWFSKNDLRTPFPRKKKNFFKGQELVGFERRGKYLIFRFRSGSGALTHLGMTGGWRVGGARRKHDHVEIKLCSSNRNISLVYEDARRFGFFEILPESGKHSLLKNLGPEPLDQNLDFEKVYEKVHTRKAPIKNLLMNSAILVGVGNIYASEALFRSGISPLKKGSRLKKEDFLLLMIELRKVLSEAIERGGSSIDDYRHLSGQRGKMQDHFFVYGREGLNCRKCDTKILRKIQAGRSTFFCPSCQR